MLAIKTRFGVCKLIASMATLDDDVELEAIEVNGDIAGAHATDVDNAAGKGDARIFAGLASLAFCRSLLTSSGHTPALAKPLLMLVGLMQVFQAGAIREANIFLVIGVRGNSTW